VDHGAGLVDKVDRLVGQEAVGDVAGRERRCRNQRRVLDLYAVMHLEALAQAAQDRDRVLHGRLVDHNGLEAALECGVLFDVAAVLVERGRADAVQLAARQHRLEHVAGVHRALGRSRTDHGMQLVDEEQDSPLGGLELGEHRLEALLELAAELGSGNQRAQIQGNESFLLQAFGHVAVDDALG